MGDKLSRELAAVLASSRRLRDVDAELIVWCGLLVLAGHGQVGASRRGRLTGVALGVVFVILGHLIEADRRATAGYHTVMRTGRRLLSRVARVCGRLR